MLFSGRGGTCTLMMGDHGDMRYVRSLRRRHMHFFFPIGILIFYEILTIPHFSSAWQPFLFVFHEAAMKFCKRIKEEVKKREMIQESKKTEKAASGFCSNFLQTEVSFLLALWQPSERKRES